MQRYLKPRWAKVSLPLRFSVLSHWKTSCSQVAQHFQPAIGAMAFSGTAARLIPLRDSVVLSGRLIGKSGLVYDIERVLQQKEAPLGVVYLAVYGNS